MIMRIVPLMAALLVLGGCMPVVSSPDQSSSGRSSSGQSSATPGAPEDIHYHHPSGEAASFGQGL
ncbi:MAG: hypothetical protein ACK53X_01395, partial [Holosporales bacterium]